MSNPLWKRSDKIKLVAKNPHKIKRALKPWADAFEGAGFDPFKWDEAPPWVEKAGAEFVKVVMPRNRMPLSGEWDMELLGEFMGRLQGIANLFHGEIPIGPDLQKDLDRLGKVAASQPQTPERTAKGRELLRSLQGSMDAVREGIPQMLAAAMASSHQDALKFQKGLSRGMNLTSDQLVTANTFERHTRTFWVLATLWSVWVRCKSRREVYEILCKAVGERTIGSFKTFEKLCDKIGMSLRGRGRPKK